MSTIAIPCICLVTDRRQLSPDARTTRDELMSLEGFVDEAVDAGVDLVQIRERDLPARLLADLVRKFSGDVPTRRTRIVVNDRCDVAMAAAADGVHLPSSAPPSDRVRAIVPRDWLIGRSIHSDREAGDSSVDYLIFGTVFPSPSKVRAQTQGIDALKAVVARAQAPVLAIGGIDPARAHQCVSAGASGAAGISIFLPEGRAPGSLGIPTAVRELRLACDRVRRSDG